VKKLRRRAKALENAMDPKIIVPKKVKSKFCHFSTISRMMKDSQVMSRMAKAKKVRMEENNLVKIIVIKKVILVKLEINLAEAEEDKNRERRPRSSGDLPICLAMPETIDGLD